MTVWSTNTFSSTYKCEDKPLSSFSEIRSAVYKMSNTGQSTDPWGTPHIRQTVDDSIDKLATYILCPTEQIRLKPFVIVSSMPKVTCRHCSKISWSTASNVADRSRRINAAKLPRSTACKVQNVRQHSQDGGFSRMARSETGLQRRY